jgi:hypothetical protein
MYEKRVKNARKAGKSREPCVFSSRFMREILAHWGGNGVKSAKKRVKMACFAELRLVASTLLENLQIEQTLG